MESNQILTMVQLILTLGAIVVFGLIYPLVILLDVISNAKDQKEKLRWILWIAITGPIAATLWSFLQNRQGWKKWSGAAGLTALLVSGIFYYNLGVEIISEMDASVSTIQSKLLFENDVGTDLKDQVSMALTSLRKDFDGYPISKFLLLSMNYRLALTLNYLSGKPLTAPKVKFWLKLVADRELINAYAYDPIVAAEEAELAR